MPKIRVNPRKGDDGKPMKAFDNIGRIIPFCEDGTEVEKTTAISRQIKFGDLVVVESMPKKVEKKKIEKKKVEVKK